MRTGMGARKLTALGLLVTVIAVAVSMLLFVGGAGAGDSKGFRWDIASVEFQKPPMKPIWTSGGVASAVADDGSKITLTGSGTFGGAPSNVTGGGNWTTFDANGNETGSGTYAVKALVSFFGAPGKFPGNDQIGDAADARAGLAVLRITYSDKARGTLVVSSHMPGTPNSVFNGITASKGPVGYWERQAPMPNVNENRTIFHG